MMVVNPLLTYTFRDAWLVTLCPDGIDCDETTAIPRVGDTVTISGYILEDIDGQYTVKFVDWQLQMQLNGRDAQRQWVAVELERIE